MNTEQIKTKLLNKRTSKTLQNIRAAAIIIFIITASLYATTQFQLRTVKGQEKTQVPPEISLPNTTTPPDDTGNSDFKRVANSMAMEKDPHFDEKIDRLIDKAEEEGSVMITIGFRYDFKLEGELTDSLRDEQHADIKQNQEEILQKIKRFKPENVKQFQTIPYLALTVNAETLRFLKTLPEITSISEDIPVAPTLAESVSLVGATAAWSAGYSGSGWAVAVLDSGVDKNHPFLSGKVVSEACYSTNNSIATSVCPNGVTQSTDVNSGLNCNTSITGCAHGTHVAGIAAGRGSSFSGVARDGNIIAVQVFSRFANQSNCGSDTAPCARTYSSDQVLGLERVMALRSSINIAAVNMSLGGGQYFSACDAVYPPETTAISNLRSVGIATIISSGNEGYTNATGHPACISSAVSVGSTGDGSFGATVNQVSSFSNSASFITLLAPGQWINSSIPGGNYSNYSGTSMAAPHVAGAWAILKQRVPTASVNNVLFALTSTGLPVTDTRNSLNSFVKPRIRVDAALQAVTTGGGECTTVQQITPGQTINGSLTTSDCVYTGTTRYVDLYAFNGTAGQRIAISMNSTAFDTYLYLVNSSNQIVAENDDSGGTTNSRIPVNSGYFTLPAAGVYTIRATSYSADSVGNYTLSLINEVSCTHSISPANQSFAASGGSGSFSVATQSGCAWSAASNASWITASGGTSGSGTVGFSVAANTSTTLRIGTITAAGQTFTVTQNGSSAISRKLYDFDGDNRADISVFRPSNGAWYIQRSTANFTAYTFGQNGDLIAPADFDGDGRTDVAVFRNGAWYYLTSSNNAFVGATFGQAGDLPRPADFDGDNKADINVFRPSNGAWYRVNSSNGAFVGLTFGQNGDKPLIANFDGDNKSDIAVFRPSAGAFYWLESTTGQFKAVGFGFGTDIPTMGDFDGDNKTDIAVFRPSNGAWYRYNSTTGAFVGLTFGQNGDIPVTADYDGDNRADIAVFRPSNGAWYYLNSSNGGFVGLGFGFGTDKPIPAAY